MTKVDYHGQIPNGGCICSDCAFELGGQWRSNHIATFRYGECPVCKSTRTLAKVSDWNWPVGEGGEDESMRD